MLEVHEGYEANRTRGVGGTERWIWWQVDAREKLGEGHEISISTFWGWLGAGVAIGVWIYVCTGRQGDARGACEV